jgi:hypothetical protein
LHSVYKCYPTWRVPSEVKLLTKFKDVFAWGYKDLKRIPWLICEQKIELIANACPIKQGPYRMNPNYAQRIIKGSW